MSEGNYRLKRELITDFMKQRMPTLCEAENPLDWWLNNNIVPNDEDLERCEGNTDNASTEPSINYDGLLALEKRSETEVCPLCNNTGEYSFGGSFGGSVQTQRCPCGRT